eukprot:2124619-Pleurochrysis_carterae.AAC.1
MKERDDRLDEGRLARELAMPFLAFGLPEMQHGLQLSKHQRADGDLGCEQRQHLFSQGRALLLGSCALVLALVCARILLHLLGDHLLVALLEHGVCAVARIGAQH